ncbi:probable chitinase 2 isoform X2 [Nylanderia fulva]|uniref:probable chitinase 2 isoform X2 n=1 Tax=Nylanderia fulva TaxID=613905 RepID=UPI0010FB08EC|nr:probable chitinase 2 isoform X2 [Nylanderia fulva]
MIFTYVAFLLLFFGTYNVHGLIKPQHDKVVVCYVASWAAYRPGNGAFSLENLHSGHCTHLIYAFAGINASNWTIKSLDPWADMEKNGIGNYRKMTALRKQGLKVSLGIGGWNEGSINYSTMASSSDHRKTFIASTVEFLRTYEFDGLDLDWEFPGNRGGALHDKQNFVNLVKELRNTFREHRFLLTAAISANKDIIDKGYNISEISKYLDYIHVMAYDYHGAWNKQVLPNTPLRSKDQLSVICEALILYPQEWTTGWDNYSSTAYAIKKDHVVVYDDRKAIMIKVEYVKKQKLAGVMVWSIDTDDFQGKCSLLNDDMALLDGHDYPLMKSINAVLANNTIPSEEKNELNSSSMQLSSSIVFALSITMIIFSFT